MSVRLLGNAPRAEVLGCQHTSRGHDPDQSVEFRQFWILTSGEQDFTVIITKLTTQASRDLARAPELETSRSMPFRFWRMSCSASKFVFGGSPCRLSYINNRYRAEAVG